MMYLTKKLEKNINVCMRVNFECSWDSMIAKLETNMASVSNAHTSWTVAKEGENGLIFMANIINFDALGDLMMNKNQL
ncbi:hypothetical protein N9809_00020 [Amylibacter sp.]|nr:hypothetical protein [Amylibacter sp.]MDB9817644.1 hypothetical protein [Amylibacter sp.]